MKTNIIEILEEYNRLGIRSQIDYDKFYLYSIITHSTAIEGSTVTEVENRLLFDEGIGAQKPLKEQLMNLDLKAAYEQAFEYAKRGDDYSSQMLCDLSALVMKNTGSEYSTMIGNFSAAKGELRLLNVSAGFGGRSYLSYQKVPSRTEEFCQWLNDERAKIDKNDIESIYALSFEAHYRLVCIHPWADGNGRMSRLVMNMIQYELGVVPSIVKKERRKQYIESLEQSQEVENSAKFLDFMLNHHCRNLKKQIDEFKQSMDDEGGEMNKTSQKTSQKTGRETSQKILELIKENTSVTTQTMADIIGIDRRNVARNIKKLQEQGIIRRVGPDKGGYWEVIDQE